ncbi:MAG: diiron oxygenase [Myxococcales bacterium]|nr:diiron oxygenase [Myxococcales bacterium]
MSILNTDYRKCLDASERVSWTLTSVVPANAKLSFSRPFMPAGMHLAQQLDSLTSAEKLKLNQIFGRAYAYLFYFVEAYIVAATMEHARAELYGDEITLRTLLRFTEEEVKHQQMFLRFGELFDRDFGTEVGLTDSPQEVAGYILSKSPMAVLLVTLHLEILTQAHYVDAMKDDAEIDPLFVSLFRHHWMEEAQHAKLDALELEKLREGASPEQIAQAEQEYAEIIAAFAGLLGRQAVLDVTSLEMALGKTFDPQVREQIQQAQSLSYRRAFLWYGLTNPVFLEYLTERFPDLRAQTNALAEQFGRGPQ